MTRRQGVLVAVPRPHVPVAGPRHRRRVRPRDRLVPPDAGARAGGVQVSCATCFPTAWTSWGGCRRLHRGAVTGFYLWYWPGVQPVGTAFVVRRGAAVRVQHVGAQGRRLRRVGPRSRSSPSPGRLRVPEHGEVVRQRDPRQAGLRCGSARGGPRRAPPRAASRSGWTVPRRSWPERYPDRAVNYLAAPVRRDRITRLGHPRVRPVDPRRRCRQHLRALDQYTGETLYDGPPGTATSSTRRGTTGASRSTRATSAARRPGRVGRAPPVAPRAGHDGSDDEPDSPSQARTATNNRTDSRPEIGRSAEAVPNHARAHAAGTRPGHDHRRAGDGRDCPDPDVSGACQCCRRRPSTPPPDHVRRRRPDDVRADRSRHVLLSPAPTAWGTSSGSIRASPGSSTRR